MADEENTDSDNMRTLLQLSAGGVRPSPIVSYTTVTMLPSGVLTDTDPLAFVADAIILPPIGIHGGALNYRISNCEALYEKVTDAKSNILLPSSKPFFTVSSEIGPSLHDPPMHGDYLLTYKSLKLSRCLSVDAMMTLLKKAANYISGGASNSVGQDEINSAAFQLSSQMTLLKFLLVNICSESTSSSIERLTEVLDALADDMPAIFSLGAQDPLPSILEAFDLNKTSNSHVDVLKSLLKNSDLVFMEKLSLRSWKQFKATSREFSDKAPHFVVLAGDVQIQPETSIIKALTGFPSIRLTSNYLFKRTGRYYYELEVLSEGLMQVGFADDSFRCDPSSGQGVGDHLHSWAFDGLRSKKWNVACDGYGRRWHIGDIVGALIDMDLLEIRFSLNGDDLGQAFVNFSAGQSVFPALSLNVRQSVRVNIGHSKFM